MSWMTAFLASLPVSLFLLWVFYLAVMNLARVKALDRADRDRAAEDPTFICPPRRMTPFVTTIGTLALLLGWALDFFVNVFVLTAVLVEVPHELTVTSRLKRHNETTYKWYEAVPWAKAVVRWFKPLLDPYDSRGSHV